MGGDWIVFESKGAKKHREHAVIATEIRESKTVQAAGKENKLLKIEAKKKIRAAWKRSFKQ